MFLSDEWVAEKIITLENFLIHRGPWGHSAFFLLKIASVVGRSAPVELLKQVYEFFISKGVKDFSRMRTETSVQKIHKGKTHIKFLIYINLSEVPLPNAVKSKYSNKNDSINQMSHHNVSLQSIMTTEFPFEELFQKLTGVFLSVTFSKTHAHWFVFNSDVTRNVLYKSVGGMTSYELAHIYFIS